MARSDAASNAGGRPRGIRLKNPEQLRYDLSRIGSRKILAQRIRHAIGEDSRRLARKYPHLPQASTIWQWLDRGKPVGWPGNSLRDLARFIQDQTGAPCARESWLQPAAAALRVCNAPRAPARLFVGRERELGELCAQLAGAQGERALAIEGLPGIGKSELALQLCHALAAEAAAAETPAFPGGIFWLGAECTDLAREWDAIACRCLGLQDEPAERRVREAIRRIERCGAPVLVVLDGVFLAREQRWEPGRGQPWPLPEGPSVRLLVTTRNEYFGASGFRHLRLGPLSRADSRALLAAASGRDGGAPSLLEGMETLLDEVGGLALALELCGLQLRRSGVATPRSVLGQLRGGDSLLRHARHTGYAARRAPEEATPHGALLGLWRALDPELRGWWALAAQREPAPGAAAAAHDPGLPARALEALSEFHLVEWDAGDSGRWDMHPAVRRFGRSAEALAELGAGA